MTLLTFEKVADECWIVETSPSGRKKLFCAGAAVSFYGAPLVAAKSMVRR
jgi:hypothetical protein